MEKELQSHQSRCWQASDVLLKLVLRILLGYVESMKTASLQFKKMKSPIGLLYLVADNKHLRAVLFDGYWKPFKAKQSSIEEGSNAVLKKAEKQLNEYFSRKRKTFDLPILVDGTDFQKNVWMSLSKIGYGQTKTYQEQATSVKNPKAVRAVGRTNGLNPMSVVLPCHRVIGKSGKLTGYAGGLKAKKFLLELEGIAFQSEEKVS